MRVRPMRRPPRQVLFFLGLSVLLLVVLSLTNRIVGALSFPLGLIAAIASLVVVPAYVVIVSVVLLPNRATSWTAFIPGALLVYGTYAIVHLLATLVLVPWVAHKQATYGVLGISAGLLFLMFVFGRVIELACSLNAILEEQRQAAGARRAEQHSPASQRGPQWAPVASCRWCGGAGATSSRPCRPCRPCWGSSWGRRHRRRLPRVSRPRGLRW